MEVSGSPRWSRFNARLRRKVVSARPERQDIPGQSYGAGNKVRFVCHSLPQSGLVLPVLLACRITALNNTLNVLIP